MGQLPNACTSDRDGINLRHDCARFQQHLASNGVWKDFQALMKPATLTSLFWMTKDFLLTIITAMLMTYSIQHLSVTLSIVIAVISLPIVASRVRSLGNQCHDIVHNNVFRRRKTNLLFARYVLFPLLWYDYDQFHTEHVAHHAHLGDVDQDLERLNRVVSIPENASLIVKFWALYRPFFFDSSLYRSSAFGDLGKIARKEIIPFLMFWTVTGAVLVITGGVLFAGVWLGLWVLARATMYHAIKVLCELCDHYRLENTTVVEYTRTMPKTILSWLFHPQNDNFHVLHHLYANVPMPNLQKAHALMMTCEEYRRGEILTSYVSGPNSLLRSLVR